MSDASAEKYMDFLSASWSETLFLEMREDDQLLGVAVTDEVSDGLSAVYTFFNPELPKRSLGTFAVLSQISMARQLGLPYLYLGYWVRDCDKMAYKAEFRPMQVFSEGNWRQFNTGESVIVPELTADPP